MIFITKHFLPHLIYLQDNTFDFQTLRPIKPYVLHLIQAHSLNIDDLPENKKIKDKINFVKKIKNIIYRSHKLNVIIFSAHHMFTGHFNFFLFVSYRYIFIYIIIIIILIFNIAKTWISHFLFFLSRIN